MNWRKTLTNLPADGLTVRIRCIGLLNQLAIATFNASTNLFTTSVTGLIIPVKFVSRWQDYLIPSETPIITDNGIDILTDDNKKITTD